MPQAPAVERQLVGDMLRRGLPVVPLAVLLAAAVWGTDGALSAAYGLGIVALNLLASAVMLGWAARTSPATLMATALGGFLVRMGLVFVALFAVRDQDWVAFVPLGITVLVSHLGLLFWETRYVSASLAFPGLKPRKGA
jgi:hypothetical protein